MALSLGEGERVVPRQIFRYRLVEFLLIVGGAELEGQRPTLCVLDVLDHLSPQCSLAEVQEPVPECLRVRTVRRVLRTEAVDVAKDFVVKDRRESEEFEQRVLEWGGGNALRHAGSRGIGTPTVAGI